MKAFTLAVMICIYAGIMEINESIVFKPTNIICESYNKTLVIIEECRLRVVSRDRVGVFITLDLKPITHITVHGQLLKKANGYKPFLINVTLNLCDFFRKKSNPFANIVFSLIKDFTNINHTCPYVGQHLIKGFYPRPELFKLPLPTGDYLLTLAFNGNGSKKPTLSVNTYFKFVEDLI